MREDERLAIPDAEGLGVSFIALGARLEVEFCSGVHEDLVHFDEDGGAELHRVGGVIVGVYGSGTTADVRGLLEDCDIYIDAGLESKFVEVVRC